MLATVNLVLTKRNSDMDPLGAVELAIGGGGRLDGNCEFTFFREKTVNSCRAVTI